VMRRDADEHSAAHLERRLPHVVATSMSGSVRPIASTGANTPPRAAWT
jgi:hypothetical protein